MASLPLPSPDRPGRPVKRATSPSRRSFTTPGPRFTGAVPPPPSNARMRADEDRVSISAVDVVTGCVTPTTTTTTTTTLAIIAVSFYVFDWLPSRAATVAWGCPPSHSGGVGPPDDLRMGTRVIDVGPPDDLGMGTRVIGVGIRCAPSSRSISPVPL
ncbi:hypothetical protein JB92DRAFT_376900 [Gautieria morchelliformis]|nr:hypothetical protein JB92DRAFT_376900 [Gautieria morchelliformis]